MCDDLTSILIIDNHNSHVLMVSVCVLMANVLMVSVYILMANQLLLKSSSTVANKLLDFKHILNDYLKLPLSQFRWIKSDDFFLLVGHVIKVANKSITSETH